jgi:multicomponent K+:H+ antiporter subunit A
MLLGYPFLTSGYMAPELPLVGKISLASAMAFDIGVYAVVFAGAMLILSVMGTVKPPVAIKPERAS